MAERHLNELCDFSAQPLANPLTLQADHCVRCTRQAATSYAVVRCAECAQSLIDSARAVVHHVERYAALVPTLM